jgi:cyclophilin family peptidyl-prolyl cis-trans isomerase
VARSDRRRSEKVTSSGIEFPGIMGVMQRNMRWLFIAGIFVLVASIGFPLLTTVLDLGEPQLPEPSATENPTTSAQATSEGSASGPVIQRQYASEPDFVLEDDMEYVAIITMENGDQFEIALLTEESPVHVNNFVFLSRNNFYDGLTFHRVIADFVVQGGDPSGTGMGGPGYVLQEESNEIYLDREGLVAMAKSSRGVSGSQFFITLGPTPWLTGDFSVFGRIASGMDTVKNITVREPGEGQPSADVIGSIEIIER